MDAGSGVAMGPPSVGQRPMRVCAGATAGDGEVMVNHGVGAGLADTEGFVLYGVGEDGGVGGAAGTGGFSDQAGGEAVAVIAHDVPDGELESGAGDGVGGVVVVEEPGNAFEVGGVGEIQGGVVGASVDVDEEIDAEEDAGVAVDTHIDAAGVGGFVASVLPQEDVFSQIVVGSDHNDRVGKRRTKGE